MKSAASWRSRLRTQTDPVLFPALRAMDNLRKSLRGQAITLPRLIIIRSVSVPAKIEPGRSAGRLHTFTACGARWGRRASTPTG
jgi:hypothetical protein